MYNYYAIDLFKCPDEMPIVINFLFIFNLDGQWETEYFPKDALRKHCIRVMKERRRNARKGHDFTKVTRFFFNFKCVTLAEQLLLQLMRIF